MSEERRKPGQRDTKLTPESQARIVSSIKAGNFFVTACQAAGVSKEAGYLWLRLGNKKDAKKIHRDFVEAVGQATAVAEELHAKNLLRAATTDWKASAWWLSHARRERWSNESTLNIAAVDASEAARDAYAKSKAAALEALTEDAELMRGDGVDVD